MSFWITFFLATSLLKSSRYIINTGFHYCSYSIHYVYCIWTQFFVGGRVAIFSVVNNVLCSIILSHNHISDKKSYQLVLVLYFVDSVIFTKPLWVSQLYLEFHNFRCIYRNYKKNHVCLLNSMEMYIMTVIDWFRNVGFLNNRTAQLDLICTYNKNKEALFPVGICKIISRKFVIIFPHRCHKTKWCLVLVGFWQSLYSQHLDLYFPSLLYRTSQWLTL